MQSLQTSIPNNAMQCSGQLMYENGQNRQELLAHNIKFLDLADFLK